MFARLGVVVVVSGLAGACSLELPPAADGGLGGSNGAGHGGSSGGGTGPGAGGSGGSTGAGGAGGATGAGGAAGMGGAGNPMWRTPATVDSGRSPHVAMGGPYATLVWTSLETVWVVKARTYKDGDSWGPAVYLQREFAGALPDAAAPRVAMNTRGVTLVTWKQQGNSELDAAFTFRLPVPPSQGDGWPGGGPLVSSPALSIISGGLQDPVVAIGNSTDDRGTWLLGNNNYIRALDFIGNGTSGTGGSVSDTGPGVACPWVAVNSHGDTMGVWIEKPATGPWAVTAWFYSPSLSQQQDLVTLGTGEPDMLGCPRVAFDDLGRALATWTVVSGGSSRVVYRSYDPTTKWGPAATTIDTGALGAYSADVALTSMGEGFIVWEQGTNASGTSPRDLRAVHLQLGRGLDAGGALSIGATAPASTVRVAAIAAGSGVAVWTQAGRAFANTFSASGGWGQAAPIDVVRTQYTSQNPELATDGKGRAIAVWESSNGAVPDVVVARFE